MFGLFRSKKDRQEPLEVDASPEVVEFYNQGSAASSRGQYEKAIQLFTKAIEADPQFVAAYINRGNAYSQLTSPNCDLSFENEQLQKANADFSKAIELDAQNGHAYWNRAVSSYVRGNYKEALSDIQNAKRLGCRDINPQLERMVSQFLNTSG